MNQDRTGSEEIRLDQRAQQGKTLSEERTNSGTWAGNQPTSGPKNRSETSFGHGGALLSKNESKNDGRKRSRGQDQIPVRAMNRPKPGVEEWGECSLSSGRPGR
jgi:hypothetical protein